MTFAPKKALIATVVAVATFVGTTGTATTTAQANEAVAAGIGFIAGAIVGSAVTQPHVVHQPQIVVAPGHRGHYAPWTPAWYASCSQRYQSFNPNTGYWLHVSGQYRFCQ